MPLTTDDVRQMTFLSTDDKAWQAEQKRKRRKPPDPPTEPEHGSCCRRCRFWSPPLGGQFGDCLALAVLGGGMRRGEIVSVEDAEASQQAWQPLGCGPAFSCSAFAARASDKEAA